MLISDLAIANSIKIANLYYKPKAIKERLSRSCQLIFLESKNTDFPLGRTGSSTLVSFENRNYVVCTRHELGIKAGETPDIEILESIRIASSGETLRNIPIKNCIFASSHTDQEFHDLLIFETASDWDQKHLDAPFFMPINPFFKGKRHFSLFVGHPTLSIVMDEYLESHSMNETGIIHIKVAIADCELVADYETNNDFYRRYKNLGQRKSLDGFSGGAVFSLIGNTLDYEFVLDGIILRGGENDLYIVDADYLVRAFGAGYN